MYAGALAPFLADLDMALRALGELEVRDGLRIDVPLLGAIALRESEAGLMLVPRGDPCGTGDATPREWTPERLAGCASLVKQVVGRKAARPGRVLVVPADGGGWGRGIFQADLVGEHTRGRIPKLGEPWPVFEQAKLAIEVIQRAREELAEFRGRPIFPKAVACRYNAGLPYVLAALRAGHDPDTVTTPGPSRRPDYGSDVLARRAALIASDPVRFVDRSLT